MKYPQGLEFLTRKMLCYMTPSDLHKESTDVIHKCADNISSVKISLITISLKQRQYLDIVTHQNCVWIL